MDKKILYASLFILLGINGYVLYKYASLKQNMENIVRDTWYDTYRANSYKISNRILVSDSTITNLIPNKVRKVIKEKNISYLLFTTNSDCSNCIVDTIEELEKVDEKIDERMFIFYQNVNQESYKFKNFFNYHELYFQKFELEHKNKFDELGINQFPIFIMYHPRHSNVLVAFQPEPNNYEFLDAFINRVKSHL